MKTWFAPAAIWFAPTAMLFSALMVLPAAAQDDKLELLLQRSPSMPNAVGYVNIGSLSALMSEQKINQTVADQVKEYWFLADLDLSSLRPKWEAGYAIVKASLDADQLAAAVGGYTDEVANTPVVWSPGQRYLVPLPDRRLGVLRPADRKLLSSWLEPTGVMSFSDFLTSKAKSPENYLSLMLSIELKDVFSPVPLEAKLADLTSLKSVSPKSAASIIASVQGATILVGRRGLNECIFRLEFTKSPKSLSLVAAEMLAEIAAKNGSAAPEVLTWAVEADETSLTFKGPITEATLSGVLGIFSLQSQASSVSHSLVDASGSRSQQEQAAYQSKHYFEQVGQIIEQTRKHKSQTTGALAKWNDQRARQIDELPVLNVDEQMLQYGSDVAETLRGNALTVREGIIDAGKTKAGQSVSNGYYGGGSGYGYDFNSSTDYQRVTDAVARGNAYTNYRDALSAIDKMTASVRRTMTQKYQIEF